MPSNLDKVSAISKQLDYSITATKDRLSLLYSLLMVYNTVTEEWTPNSFLTSYFSTYYNANIKQNQPLSHSLPVCYNLSYMAGYILFNKEEGDIGVVREKTQKGRDLKHISLQQVVEEQGEEAVREKETSYLQVRPTVTAEDEDKMPELADYTKYIEAVQQQMERAHNSRDRYKLRQILKEARQDRLAAKMALKPPTTYTQTYSSSCIDYYEDTKYTNDAGKVIQVSHNKINLDTPKHILELLKHYAQLRHHTYDKVDSDIRYILDTLDEIIEDAPLNKHFRYILIRRIDGATYDVIAHELQEQLGLKFSPAYISSVFTSRIPQILSTYYADSYEEWYYTHREKGDYKKCTRCGTNWLRDAKYYRRDSKSNDGLSTICKVCRSEQDARSKEKRLKEVS